MKKIITILSLVIMIGLMVSCSSPFSTPSGTVKYMTNNLISGNYDKVVECVDYGFVSADEIEATKKVMIASMELGEKTQPIDIKSFTIKEETISEDGLKATVILENTSNDGRVDTIKRNLIKKDGRWYVVIFED